MSILVAVVGSHRGARRQPRVRTEADAITRRRARRAALQQIQVRHAEADCRGEGLPALRRSRRCASCTAAWASRSSAALDAEIRRARATRDVTAADALEQVKVKTMGYETTFLEARHAAL